MKCMKVNKMLSVLTLVGSLLMAPMVFAEEAASQGMGGSALTQGLMLGAFVLVFYFFIIRPQSKRAKEHRDLIDGLQKGDEVVTNGGIVGKINRISGGFFIISIAEGIEVAIQKQAIAAPLPKDTMKNL